jgi:hypothetical protein
VGAHHARIIYCSNNRKPEESPQNESMKHHSEHITRGIIPDLPFAL